MRHRRRDAALAYASEASSAELVSGISFCQAHEMFNVFVLVPFALILGGKAAGAVLFQEGGDAIQKSWCGPECEDFLRTGRSRQLFQEDAVMRLVTIVCMDRSGAGAPAPLLLSHRNADQTR